MPRFNLFLKTADFKSSTVTVEATNPDTARKQVTDELKRQGIKGATITKVKRVK